MSKNKRNANQSVSPVLEPHNMLEIAAQVGNTYEAIAVISKRANQIHSALREELHGKLEEFTTTTDNLEEVHENREQIEISKYYERLPNASLIAIQEYLEGKIYFRNPTREKVEGVDQ